MMKLVLLESGELSTEAQPVPSASIPNITAPRHERKMPEQMKLLLEPGAENTPWGDLFWRMYGRPDGSLGEELNQEALAHWEEIVACKITTSHVYIIYDTDYFLFSYSVFPSPHSPSPLAGMSLALVPRRSDPRTGN